MPRAAFPGSVTTSGVMWVCSSPPWGWVLSQGLGMGVGKRGNRNTCAHVRGDGIPFSVCHAALLTSLPPLPPSPLQCPPPLPMTLRMWLSPGCPPRSSPAMPLACPHPRCRGARRGLSWAAEEGATASCPQVQAQGSAAPAGWWVPASSPAASPLPDVFPGALEIRQALPAHPRHGPPPTTAHPSQATRARGAPATCVLDTTIAWGLWPVPPVGRGSRDGSSSPALRLHRGFARGIMGSHQPQRGTPLPTALPPKSGAMLAAGTSQMRCAGSVQAACRRTARPLPRHGRQAGGRGHPPQLRAASRGLGKACVSL